MVDLNEKITAYFIYRHRDKKEMSREIKSKMTAVKACNAFNAASRDLHRVGRIVDQEGTLVKKFDLFSE